MSEGTGSSGKQPTDAEKAIYLKLVALAVAGKIVWVSENIGTYGGFTIYVYGVEVTVNKREDDVWHLVASMRVQDVGDLATIAKEQYGVYRQKLIDEFMNA